MIHIVESHLGTDKPGDPTKLYVKLGIIGKACFLGEQGSVQGQAPNATVLITLGTSLNLSGSQFRSLPYLC